MVIYEQAVQFSSFDDYEKIQEVLDSTEDQVNIYNQMFKFACIQNAFNAVQYIYEQSLIKKIPLQIHNGLILSIVHLRNYNLNYADDDDSGTSKIISYFIQQNIDVRFDNDKLLSLAIKHNQSSLICELYDYCQYNEKKIISLLYEDVINHYNYSLLKSLIQNGHPDLIINQINQFLNHFKDTNNFNVDSNDFIEFIHYLLQQGGNASLLNNSLIIPALIWNEKFSDALKLISHGIDISKMCLSTIEFVIDDFIDYDKDCDMLQIYQKFKSYAQNNNVQFKYSIDSLESKIDLIYSCFII